jgi:hypothetical protein
MRRGSLLYRLLLAFGLLCFGILGVVATIISKMVTLVEYIIKTPTKFIRGRFFK